MTAANRHFVRHYIEMLVAMLIEHIAMQPSMLVATLLRRKEYSGGEHARGQVRRVAA